MNIFEGRVRWGLIFWILAISAVSFLDRVNISIAGPSIEREFHLDHVQLGWVFSAWILGYALFQAPSGRLADRFGPRRILFLGTVWWAVFTALTALVPATIAACLALLVIVRFLLGMGESIMYPASNRLVAAWIPSQERGLANGLIFAGVGLGSAVTPPFIAYIIYHYGWRSSLWACGVIGLVIGGFWFYIARDEPNHHPWVSPEEASFISAGLPHATRSVESQSLPPRQRLADYSCQSRCVGFDHELLWFCLCCLHFFHLVLHLPEHSSRLESKSECWIFRAPIRRYGGRFLFGRVDQRSHHAAVRQTRWTLLLCQRSDSVGCRFRRIGNARPRC